MSICVIQSVCYLICSNWSLLPFEYFTNYSSVNLIFSKFIKANNYIIDVYFQIFYSILFFRHVFLFEIIAHICNITKIISYQEVTILVLVLLIVSKFHNPSWVEKANEANARFFSHTCLDIYLTGKDSHITTFGPKPSKFIQQISFVIS